MPAPAPKDRLIDLKEVTRILGVSKTTVYQLIKDKKFKAPRKIGSSSRWSERYVLRVAGLLDADLEELL